MTPSLCQLSVQNACGPAKEGGMQSAMAYQPIGGLFAHSLIHLVFILLHSCWRGFTMVVVSVVGLSSVASFAIVSALSFPSIPMTL